MSERRRQNQIVIQGHGRKPAPLHPWVYYRDPRELVASVIHACRALERSMGITPPKHVEILGAWQECRGRFVSDNVEYRFFPVVHGDRDEDEQARATVATGVPAQPWRDVA